MITLIFYLAIAFGNATFIPSEMSESSRGIASIFWAMAMVISPFPIFLESNYTSDRPIR